MARNKYPEETVKLILDTAARLFLEKGYDKTSLQDIINETKLSKGAIYHHFASKEEIFVRICERIGEDNARILVKVRDNREWSGMEKLRQIFRASLIYTDQERILHMTPYLLNSPKFLAMQIKSIYSEAVPDFLEPIIREGIEDGSIRTDYPRELAEVLLTLSNVWIHPLLQPTTPKQIRARCAVFNQMTESFGMRLLDDELVETLVKHSRLLRERSDKKDAP